MSGYERESIEYGFCFNLCACGFSLSASGQAVPKMRERFRRHMDRCEVAKNWATERLKDRP